MIKIKKIHILYELQEGFKGGGGNQFLKILKKELIQRELYAADPNEADCIIFNSHHNFKKVLKFKLKNKSKLFIHRIDGPLALHRAGGKNFDNQIYNLNNLLADGTVFQSEWSKKKNYQMGLNSNIFEKVIYNSSDGEIFYPEKKTEEKNINKSVWQLIAVSWSKNKNKGFELYKFLDENLDYNNFSMIFVGNSPFNFKNIKHLDPLKPKELAQQLRGADIYITGAMKEACSNSIIEALMCGLPCIVINDASNPEILRNGGVLFDSFSDCIEKIDLVIKNYDEFRRNIEYNSIQDCADQYLQFMNEIVNSKDFRTKKLTRLKYYKYILKLMISRNLIRINLLFKKMKLKNKM